MLRATHRYMGPKGFQAAGIASGIKAAHKAKDLALIYSESPAQVAGLFTRNRVKAAPVLATRQRVRRGVCRALIINSGNANACTGGKGRQDAETMTQLVGAALAIPSREVLVASTGVIGHPLPMALIEQGIPAVAAQLTSQGFPDAAEAIMTTDTHPKIVTEKVRMEGDEVTILGMAKGAGMIRPQLATMLAFIMTDAQVDAAALSAVLHEGVGSTFHRITIDGDTSTNDMLLLMANGQASTKALRPRGSRFRIFQEAVVRVMDHLARAIVGDGEGRTKVVEICVRGGKDSRMAERLAFRIAHSPLVKTAFFGQDPNWGRIMAAMGDAGVAFDPQKVSIYFGDVMVVAEGIAAPGASEEQMRRVLGQDAVTVTIDLHAGTAQTTVLTNDLTYDYVKINASYHT
jgi:glutamate N-acetyltransferase/amino-acid N-acetyltransferase